MGTVTIILLGMMGTPFLVVGGIYGYGIVKNKRTKKKEAQLQLEAKMSHEQELKNLARYFDERYLNADRLIEADHISRREGVELIEAIHAVEERNEKFKRMVSMTEESMMKCLCGNTISTSEHYHTKCTCLSRFVIHDTLQKRSNLVKKPKKLRTSEVRTGKW